MPRRSAFTLVELLVVIAIISLLIAIIAPTLGAARDLARSSYCKTTLHALNKSSLIYTEQNSGYMMVYRHRGTPEAPPQPSKTTIALTIGGVMFIMVISVGASFRNTIDMLLNDFGFDVLVVFERSYHVDRLIEVGKSVPGVASVEVWDIRGATLEQENGEEIQGQLWGVPDNSRMFTPRIVSGRGLLPEDGRAILLNNKIAVDEGIPFFEPFEYFLSDITFKDLLQLIGLKLNTLFSGKIHRCLFYRPFQGIIKPIPDPLSCSPQKCCN